MGTMLIAKEKRKKKLRERGRLRLYNMDNSLLFKISKFYFLPCLAYLKY